MGAKHSAGPAPAAAVRPRVRAAAAAPEPTVVLFPRHKTPFGKAVRTGDVAHAARLLDEYDVDTGLAILDDCFTTLGAARGR